MASLQHDGAIAVAKDGLRFLWTCLVIRWYIFYIRSERDRRRVLMAYRRIPYALKIWLEMDGFEVKTIFIV